MTTDAFIKGQLALLCWRNSPPGREAGSKTFENMRCIGLIERNRIQAGWHGGNWLELIQHDKAYGANEVHAAEELTFPDTRDDIFQRFLWEVDRIYDGSAADPMTEGALWYADIERPTRAWFMEHIAGNEKHQRVAQVANLVLWR